MRLNLLLVVAIGGTATAQTPAPQPVMPASATAPVPDAVKALNGYYKPASVIAEGAEQMTTPESKAGVVLKIKDGSYSLFAVKDAKADTGFRLCTAALAVGPDGKTFELTVTDGYRKGQRLHGLIEHAGDKLRVCYGPADKPRPTGFDAPKGSGYFCETWVAEKK